jgi:hypothetical protein
METSYIETNSELEDSFKESPSTQKENLPDWKNIPNVRDLRQELLDATPDHTAQVDKVNVWLDNLNIKGRAVVKSNLGFSAIVPKVIRKQAEWRYASLSEPFLSTNDIFNTAPVTYEDKQAAIQNGLVLNNQFNTKLDKIKFIDEYVRTAVDEGTVIIRVGWELEEEEIEVEVPDFEFIESDSPQLAQQYQQLTQLAQQSPEKFTQSIPQEVQEAMALSEQSNTLLEAVQTGSHVETEINTIKNCPTLEICKYTDVIIDPTCQGDLDKANFVIYSFETSYAQLKKENRYFDLDNIRESNVSPEDNINSQLGQDYTFHFKDKPRRKFVAYEYWGFWDITGTGVLEPIVATWVGDTLIRMEENPFPDKKLPFISVQYLPTRKSIYGEPDGALLEDNQKIIGAVTRGMIDIMGRSANGQQGTRVDALDTVNKKKFSKGLDYEFTGNSSPDQLFHMHTYPEIPRSAETMIQMQNAEAESLTGIKAFSTGISGKAISGTATGIRSALDATSKRELGILRRLAEGIKKIGRKFISMNSEFLSEEEVIRITNEEFISVRRDDLEGNIDILLDISTAEADEQKASELAFMLQTIAPNEDPEVRKMLLAEIFKLRKMPELSKRIAEYQPPPDEEAIKKAKLENALLEAQIYKENSMAEENLANAKLYEARVGLETARAANTESDRDLKDLKYVEQESGTLHARELDVEDNKVNNRVNK